MGDRVIELGMITSQGATEISRFSQMFNPGRAIPPEAQWVHGISDKDVSDSPLFKEFAGEIESTVIDSWVVGHNVRLDIGFMSMELQQAGCSVTPVGCLETCQLASALWDFRNYQLATVVNALKMPTSRLHRALDDAAMTREDRPGRRMRHCIRTRWWIECGSWPSHAGESGFRVPLGRGAHRIRVCRGR